MLGGLRARLDEDPILVVPAFQDVEHAQRELAERGAVFGALVLRFERLYREIAARAGYGEPVASEVQRQLLLEASVKAGRAERARRVGVAAGLRSGSGALRGRARAGPGGPGPLHAGVEGLGRGRAETALCRRGGGDLRRLPARPRERRPRGPRAVRLARSRCAPAGARALGRHPALRLRLRRLHRARARRAGDAVGALRRAPVRVAALRAGTGGVPGYRDGARSAVRDRHRQAGAGGGGRALRGRLACGAPSGGARPVRGRSRRRRWRRGRRSPSTRPAGRGPRSSWRRHACSTCCAAAPRPATWRSCSAIPTRYSSLVEQVFGAYGVPYSLDRSLPFAHTGLGRGLLALIRCGAPAGTADDLLAYLRTPGLLTQPALADRLEARVRQEGAHSAERARAIWESEHWALTDLERLTGAQDTAAYVDELQAVLAHLFSRAVPPPRAGAGGTRAGRPARVPRRAEGSRRAARRCSIAGPGWTRSGCRRCSPG